MIKDGELLVTPKEGARRGGFKFCSIGSVPLELVQPGGAIRDVNGDFLAKLGGGGINHIGFKVDAEHFEEVLEKMKAKGLDVLLSGRQAGGGGFVYFDTREVGGFIIELYW